MAKNRIRCPQCTKNFCVQCNSEPYHIGKTCEQEANKAQSCRYCLDELKQPSPSMKPAFRYVCRKSDCFTLMQKSCDKVLDCGHPCKGVNGETECLPCLEAECIEKMPTDKQPKGNADDYCPICYCSANGQEPCVVLDCKHVFHVGCLKQKVDAGYNGPRIVFNFLDCPECKTRISCP